MDFQALVGKTFSESEFYETLLFEVEENFELYLSKHLHFYFDRLSAEKIRINEVVCFPDRSTITKQKKKIIEDKEWFEINEDHGHINLSLCRFDRSGKGSTIERNHTHTQEKWFSWADEYPSQGPLSPEEIRQGFRELAGMFESKEHEPQLRPKKAV